MVLWSGRKKGVLWNGRWILPCNGCSPVETGGVPVSRGRVADVEIGEVQLPIVDEEIIGNEDTNHWGQENGPTGDDAAVMK